MEYLGIQSQIRRNNFRSTLLLVLFPAIIVGLTWVFFFILMYLDRPKGYDEYGNVIETPMNIDLANSMFLPILPWVIIICGVWFTIAYFSHTSMINAATSAHSLSRKENMRVYNLVENLCMSVGMKMPMINVMEDDSINAFASGINEKTFSVTLSRGAIDRLTDDELEGVIAHELTHIRNRDVRLLIVSIIFVGIFAFLAQMLLRTLFYSRGGGGDRNKDKGAVLIVVALVLAAIGYLICMLMRFAISRKREYMADAGAAQLTKKPLALASALKKISKDNTIEALTRQDVAQLFIEHTSNASGFAAGLFATHPPIEKRIQVLEQF